MNAHAPPAASMRLLALLAVLGQPASAHLLGKAHGMRDLFDKTRQPGQHGVGHGGQPGNPHGWTFPAAAILHDWRHHAELVALGAGDIWEAMQGNVAAEKMKVAVLEKKVEMLERRLKAQSEERDKLESRGKDAAKDLKAAKDKAGRKQQELEAEKKRRSKFEKDLKAERASAGKLRQELKAERDSVGKLKQELASVGARTRHLEAQHEDACAASEAPREALRGPTLAESVATAALLSMAHGAVLMDGMEGKACIVLALAILLLTRRAEQLEAEVRRGRSSERKAQDAAARLEEELQAELGGMMTVGSPRSGPLAAGFSWRVWDETSDKEPVRKVQIQCPGARHQDVSIDLIFNGCVVRIARPSTDGTGVDGQDFAKQFQFRPSDGRFEFRADKAALDQGCLHLEFHPSDPLRGVFLFPPHHQLDASDREGAWELPSETSTTESHSLGAEHSDGEEDFELLHCCRDAPPSDPSADQHPASSCAAETGSDGASEFEKVGDS